eukprot:m.361962 g.361962  ORF g.361962 m.361962 type:complete len:521 (-) comp20024_c0_seq1:195-1757(-)
MSVPFGFGEEVAVISDELVTSLLAEQATDSIKAYNDAGDEDQDVTTLKLDFQRILKIENLWTYTSLTHLQLDNNIIERIEGLECLVNLEWLDLSFNAIETIEGLDTLTKLTDLSLHHNSISTLSNMDALVNLQVFSIGENNLTSLEDAPVLYLRRFKQLRCLNLAGNPLTEDERYESYVAAYLPTLVYLDYIRLAPDTKQAALLAYQDKLEVVQTQEDEEEKKAKLEAEERAQQQKLLDACVPGMSGSDFFNTVMSSQVLSLKLLPEIDELLSTFEEKFNAKVHALTDVGIEHCELRKQERDELIEALQEGVKDTDAEAAALVLAFIDKKHDVLAAVADHTAPSDQLLTDLQTALVELKETLLSLEVDLGCEIEATLGKFERNYTELMAKFTETVQATFAELREMEEDVIGELTTLASNYLDAVIKGEIEPIEFPLEMEEIIRDKTALASAMSTAHDDNVAEIDNKEDQVMGLAKQEVQGLVDRLQTEEAVRNRKRVAEIVRLTKYHRTDIQHVLEDLTA